MNSFIVKICGITCEEDAQAAVDAGANALGFNFYPKSPRYISPERALQIMEHVSGDYLKVGIFVGSGADSQAAASRLLGTLDVLQLYGEIDLLNIPADCRIWRALPAGATPPSDETMEAVLLDSFTPAYGGSGRTFDWKLARNFSQRVIIAGGLDGSNVEEAIQVAHPWGVDACSRLELTPGKKDPKRVREFVRAALDALHVSEGIVL
jgi:phosphoribosylanthranilate isomerase